MSGWAGCQAWMTVAGNSKEICVTGRQGLSCVCVCVSRRRSSSNPSPNSSSVSHRVGSICRAYVGATRLRATGPLGRTAAPAACVEIWRALEHSARPTDEPTPPCVSFHSSSPSSHPLEYSVRQSPLTCLVDWLGNQTCLGVYAQNRCSNPARGSIPLVFRSSLYLAGEVVRRVDEPP